MSIRKSFIFATAASVIAAGALTLPLSASAQVSAQEPNKPRHTAEEIAKAKPSATFEVQAEQLRLLIGGASGKGTLVYQGKSYPFTVKGLSVGGIGVTKVNAVGTVYFMDKLEDFAGTYSAVGAGATVGKGVGASQYENQKGVFLNVKSKTEGLGLSLGAGGVQIEFAK